MTSLVHPTASERRSVFARRRYTPYLVWGALPLLLCLIVLYPVEMLVSGSFSDAPPGEAGNFTLANYIKVFSDSYILHLAGTSFGIALLATAAATTSGVFIAWLVSRTDIAGKPFIEAIAILPFLTPSILLAIGWAMMANPDAGLLNKLWWAIVGGDTPLLDVYTFSGVAFVMSLHPAGFVYLMAVGPFRNLDADLENSARTSGATEWQIFRRIQLPLIATALVPAVVYTGIRAFEAFEIPVVIGTPARVMVFTNEIYYRLKITTPPQYGWSLALAAIMTVMFGLALLMLMRQRNARSVVTITGKGYRTQSVRLGPLKWLCYALVLLYALCTSILPLATIVWSSFFPSFGVFDLKAFTLSNYFDVLGDPAVIRALGNTLTLVFVVGIGCVLAATFTAYIIKRQLPAWRTAVTAIVSIPWAMPGLVLGLAMLWAYIRVPGMYGSLLGVGAAFFTLGLAISISSVNANFDQLGAELEESANVHGASVAQTFRRILLPLLWPSMIAAWFVLASIFSRELAMSSLLYGYGSEVLSVVLLRYWEQGRGNYAAVVSMIFIVLMLIMFVAERLLVRRRD